VGKFISQLTLGHRMPAFWLAVQKKTIQGKQNTMQ